MSRGNTEESPETRFRELACLLVRRERFREELRDVSDAVDDLAADLVDFAGETPITVDGYTVMLEPTEDTPIASLVMVRDAAALSWPSSPEPAGPRYRVQKDPGSPSWPWDVIDTRSSGEVFEYFATYDEAFSRCHELNRVATCKEPYNRSHVRVCDCGSI